MSAQERDDYEIEPTGLKIVLPPQFQRSLLIEGMREQRMKPRSVKRTDLVAPETRAFNDRRWIAEERALEAENRAEARAIAAEQRAYARRGWLRRFLGL
jgi:hypothetical protein